MTAPRDLAAIRERRHFRSQTMPDMCAVCWQPWRDNGCDAAQLVAALEAAQADNERLQAVLAIVAAVPGDSEMQDWAAAFLRIRDALAADRATGAEAVPGPDQRFSIFAPDTDR